MKIENQDVEKLLDDVVRMTGETETEAVRRALEERRRRLDLGITPRRDEARLLTFLREEVWTQIPTEQKGKRLSKEEEEAILGYGKSGV